MLNVIMLNVILLNVIMLNVIMLNAILLNVIIQNAVIVNVIILNVVAPLKRFMIEKTRQKMTWGLKNKKIRPRHDIIKKFL